MGCSKCHKETCGGCGESPLSISQLCNPIPCDQDQCPESYNARCTFYMGDPIMCGNDEVVSTGDSLEAAQQKIIAYFCNAVGQIQLIPGPQGDPGINGQDGQDGQDGAQGLPGIDGQDGVGIQSINWTSNSGGQPQGTQGTTDTYTITLTDLSTYVFVITNGADGAPGTPGAAMFWDTLTNAGPQSVILTQGNIGLINRYSLAAYSEITLPSAGLSVGDVIEIVDDKSSLPSETRITCPVGVTIKGFGLSTTTRLECPGSINGTVKLTYAGSNIWIITNYLYDNGAGLLYPTFV